MTITSGVQLVESGLGLLQAGGNSISLVCGGSTLELRF